ncbi:MAG: NAD(+)/NADH kinase [Chloroflexi bacterium]|nr:NAD(+)/NADH kinase [Chloroflexota bacterium]
MTKLEKIGVLAHPHRPETLPIADQIAAELEQRGFECWKMTTWSTSDVNKLVPGTDLVIAIGGDGAMLRAARVCAPHNVPLLGMNFGYLGFLAEIGPDAWPTAIERIATGDYWVEQRMMLGCEVWHNEHCLTTETALNDVVISRGAVARSVRLEAYIDGAWTTTYNADGVIIATPTGSTAYALAVGGPLLPPELRNILILPVAPHLTMDRPMVLSEGTVIKVVVAPRSFEPEVVVTVDGIPVAQVSTKDQITVKASEQVSGFVRLREPGYFFRSILDRLEPRLAVLRRSEAFDD